MKKTKRRTSIGQQDYINYRTTMVKNKVFDQR